MMSYLAACPDRLRNGENGGSVAALRPLLVLEVMV